MPGAAGGEQKPPRIPRHVNKLKERGKINLLNKEQDKNNDRKQTDPTSVNEETFNRDDKSAEEEPEPKK